jgi:polyhydroxyalkanoate synthesis repressor PhaR
MRVIKRYDNRKLYDTQTSKTVNLGEIADLIRQGEEVQVVDSQGQDITPKILGQIFLQENIETKQLMFNKFVLQGLIQESQNMESVIKKFLLGGIGLATLTRERLEELVNELIERGELAEDQRSKFIKELMSKSTENIHRVMDKVTTGPLPENPKASKEERMHELEDRILAMQKELEGLKRKQTESEA